MTLSSRSSSRTPALRRLLDQALDRSVVLGWSRIGHGVRRRVLWREGELSPGALSGRHVVVTGATSGIGEAAAHRLAGLGAVVHLVGRTLSKTRRVSDGISAEHEGAEVEVHECDVADLDAVRRLGDELRAADAPVHALLHNAGTMEKERKQSSQGHELTLATHVLGPFLLTRLLADRLGAGGRVVFMSSGGMYAQPIVIDDLEHRENYSGTVAYARTKHMLVDLAPVWNHTLQGDVTAHSMHPGWVDTPGVAEHLPRFHRLTRPILRPSDEGADTLVWLAAAPDAERHGGAFWEDRAPRPTAYLGRNATSPHDVRTLWRFCTAATDDWCTGP